MQAKQYMSEGQMLCRGYQSEILFKRNTVLFPI